MGGERIGLNGLGLDAYVRARGALDRFCHGEKGTRLSKALGRTNLEWMFRGWKVSLPCFDMGSEMNRLVGEKFYLLRNKQRRGT